MAYYVDGRASATPTGIALSFDVTKDLHWLGATGPGTVSAGDRLVTVRATSAGAGQASTCGPRTSSISKRHGDASTPFGASHLCISS